MKSMLANREETMWHTRITRALEWRKMHSFENHWPMIDKMYSHQFEETASMPHFNLIYMMGQTLVPNLVFQAPGIINSPARDDMTFVASLWDSIDNSWIRKSEIKEVAKEVVLSSYLHNTTATQIGYDFGTESDELENDKQDMFGNVDGTTNRARAQNMPWVDSIPSHRSVVAVGTRAMRNCPWAAKLVSTPTKLLKGKKGLKNVQSTKIPEAVLAMERHIWKHKDQSKWTHFWEIHDAESGKFCWLGTHGKYIVPPTEDPLQVFGLPFEITSFNKTSSSVYGTPDAEYIMSQQLEGDELRMHSMYMRRFSLPKFVYDSSVISPKEVAQMLLAEVGPGIEAKLGQGGEDDIRKHIYMFTPPNSLIGNREYGKDLLNDAQLINGFGPNQMGMQSKGRHTKYETQVAESSSTTRLSYRRNDIAEMIRGHVIRANMLIAKHWTGPIIEQVVGVDGAMYWVKAAPEQLKNIEHGLVTEVNVESLAPVSRERRKAEATNLLGLLGNMQTAGMNTMPLIKQLLSTYEWIDVSQVLPQMSGEMELAAWEELQKRKLSDGANGPQAAQNMQGLQSLGARLPSETNSEAGEQNGNRTDNY